MNRSSNNLMVFGFLFGSAISGLMILLSFGLSTSFGADISLRNGNDSGLEKLLAEYFDWNVNMRTEDLPEEGNQCVIKPGDVNFLLDPFSKGTVTQMCDVKSGSSLLFPFYDGWCDNGGHDLYGEQSYKKLLDCTLDADKGIVTMVAWLDDNKIIDIKVNNKDVNNLKVVYDNLPQNGYYKVIKSPTFFNLTVTNGSRFASTAYEKPEDFQSSPVIYKAVGHCFCGLVTNLTAGTHELRYKTVIEGTGGIAEGKGWDQATDVTYKFNVS
jgi:hypothetical protein